MTRILTTEHDLEERVRGEMISLLNEVLADATHLQLQAKLAHWNVKGPDFFQLHELFDKLFTSATEWNDLIAERAVQLGGVAEGSLSVISARTTLPDYRLDIRDGRAHLEAVIGSVAKLAARVREGIATAESAIDAGTADLLTEVSRGLDKMLWFLESHLQADR